MKSLIFAVVIFVVFCSVVFFCWPRTPKCRPGAIIGDIPWVSFYPYIAPAQFQLVLEEVLSKSPKSRHVALFGLPLSGKTTLLYEIAENPHVHHRYDNIIWVNFRSEITLQRELECNSTADVWRLLNTKRLLVIIDNVPDHDAVADVALLIGEYSPSFLLYAVDSAMRTIQQRPTDVALTGLNYTASMDVMCLVRDVSSELCKDYCEHSNGYCPRLLKLTDGHPYALIEFGQYLNIGDAQEILEGFDSIPTNVGDQMWTQRCLHKIWFDVLESLRNSAEPDALLALHIINLYAYFFRTEQHPWPINYFRIATLTKFHDRASIFNAIEILMQRQLMEGVSVAVYPDFRIFKLHPLLLAYVAGRMSEERVAAYDRRLVESFHSELIRQTWLE
jgi:hypothetical protein